jgi:hypothetical protein
VPPVTIAVAVPLFNPEQVMFVDVQLTLIDGGAARVMLQVVTHPLASFMLTVEVPAASPVAMFVVCTGLVFHV